MRPLTFFAAAGCALALAATGLASGGKVAPPVITESFEALPCPNPKDPRTTLEMQGCAQREILRTNALINARAKAIFSLLRTEAARTRFVRAQKGWLAYRRADCLSVSDVHEGGSLATVEFASCTVTRNLQRLRELAAFAKGLRGP